MMQACFLLIVDQTTEEIRGHTICVVFKILLLYDAGMFLLIVR
jgi:sulfur relay (sulfurtransferase) DsrF/TusC family protein